MTRNRNRTTARPAINKQIISGFYELLKLVPVSVRNDKTGSALDWMQRIIEWHEKPDVQTNLQRKRKAVRAAKLKAS